MTHDILVLGATGKTGRRVTDALRKTGATVRAASRSGAVRFDWFDPTTRHQALTGATAAYVIAPSAITPFIDQAGAAGPRNLVLLSGKGLDDVPKVVDVHDIAEVAALVLTSGDTHAGRTCDLTGPEALTFDEAVDKIAKALGRPVELARPTPDQYREILLEAGIPDPVITELNGMYEAMRNGLLATPTDDVPRLLGRPATDFDTYVAGALDAWR